MHTNPESCLRVSKQFRRPLVPSRLNDAPEAGEVMRLRPAVLNLPGSSVMASDVVAISPTELFFTASNYTPASGGMFRVDYTGKQP